MTRQKDRKNLLLHSIILSEKCSMLWIKILNALNFYLLMVEFALFVMHPGLVLLKHF